MLGLCVSCHKLPHKLACTAYVEDLQSCQGLTEHGEAVSLPLSWHGSIVWHVEMHEQPGMCLPKLRVAHTAGYHASKRYITRLMCCGQDHRLARSYWSALSSYIYTHHSCCTCAVEQLGRSALTVSGWAGAWCQPCCIRYQGAQARPRRAAGHCLRPEGGPTGAHCLGLQGDFQQTMLTGQLIQGTTVAGGAS